MKNELRKPDACSYLYKTVEVTDWWCTYYHCKCRFHQNLFAYSLDRNLSKFCSLCQTFPLMTCLS